MTSKERRESKEIEWLLEEYPEYKREKVNYLIEFLKLIRVILIIPFIPILFLSCYWLERKEKRRGKQ
jgi:hypothetical protein